MLPQALEYRSPLDSCARFFREILSLLPTCLTAFGRAVDPPSTHHYTSSRLLSACIVNRLVQPSMLRRHTEIGPNTRSLR